MKQQYTQTFNQFLNERFNDFSKRRQNQKRRNPNWVNSPTLAYMTVYGKKPEEPINGLSDSPKKKYGKIYVDKNLKNKWLDALNNLPVEIRSTEEGKSEIRVAHVAFRFNEKDEDIKKIKLFEKELNKLRKYNIYAKFDIGGDEKRPRLMVAGKTWQGQKDWVKWWENVSDYILNTYNKIFKDNAS